MTEKLLTLVLGIKQKKKMLLIFTSVKEICDGLYTLVNVYVDLLVFTRIAGTSKTRSGVYLC